MKKQDKINFSILSNCISSETIEYITSQNNSLITKKGASIKVESLTKNTLNLTVNNINGKRTSKYELLDFTYKLFSTKVPCKYRITIKV